MRAKKLEATDNPATLLQVLSNQIGDAGRLKTCRHAMIRIGIVGVGFMGHEALVNPSIRSGRAAVQRCECPWVCRSQSLH